MIFQSVFGLLAAPFLLPKGTGHYVGARHSGPVRTGEACEHMQVMVASKDVWRVRLALVEKPRTRIVRCTPLPNEQFAQLEIQFPLGHSASVIHCIVCCTDHGAFGSVSEVQKTRALPPSGGTLASQSIAAFAPHGQHY